MKGIRDLTPDVLNNLGYNGFGFKMIVDSYKQRVAPMPVKVDYHPFADEVDNERIMQKLPEKKLEMYLSTPGYLGMKHGSVSDLDQKGLKFVLRSIYREKKKPLSFLMNGVEVHVRNAEVSDSEVKNIARDLLNK